MAPLWLRASPHVASEAFAAIGGGVLALRVRAVSGLERTCAMTDDELHELRTAQESANMWKGVAARYERERSGPLPMWAHVVSVVGFPTFVALILLAMFLGVINSPLTEARDILKAHATDDSARTRIIRVMCRHAAVAMKQNPDECEPR